MLMLGSARSSRHDMTLEVTAGGGHTSASANLETAASSNTQEKLARSDTLLRTLTATA
jgi:hypothetical protein